MDVLLDLYSLIVDDSPQGSLLIITDQFDHVSGLQLILYVEYGSRVIAPKRHLMGLFPVELNDASHSHI